MVWVGTTTPYREAPRDQHQSFTIALKMKCIGELLPYGLLILSVLTTLASPRPTDSLISTGTSILEKSDGEPRTASSTCSVQDMRAFSDQVGLHQDIESASPASDREPHVEAPWKENYPLRTPVMERILQINRSINKNRKASKSSAQRALSLITWPFKAFYNFLNWVKKTIGRFGQSRVEETKTMTASGNEEVEVNEVANASEDGYHTARTNDEPKETEPVEIQEDVSVLRSPTRFASFGPRPQVNYQLKEDEFMRKDSGIQLVPIDKVTLQNNDKSESTSDDSLGKSCQVLRTMRKLTSGRKFEPLRLPLKAFKNEKPAEEKLDMNSNHMLKKVGSFVHRARSSLWQFYAKRTNLYGHRNWGSLNHRGPSVADAKKRKTFLEFLPLTTSMEDSIGSAKSTSSLGFPLVLPERNVFPKQIKVDNDNDKNMEATPDGDHTSEAHVALKHGGDHIPDSIFDEVHYVPPQDHRNPKGDDDEEQGPIFYDAYGGDESEEETKRTTTFQKEYTTDQQVNPRKVKIMKKIANIRSYRVRDSDQAYKQVRAESEVNTEVRTTTPSGLKQAGFRSESDFKMQRFETLCLMANLLNTKSTLPTSDKAQHHYQKVSLRRYEHSRTRGSPLPERLGGKPQSPIGLNRQASKEDTPQDSLPLSSSQGLKKDSPSHPDQSFSKSNLAEDTQNHLPSQEFSEKHDSVPSTPKTYDVIETQEDPSENNQDVMGLEEEPRNESSYRIRSPKGSYVKMQVNWFEKVLGGRRNESIKNPFSSSLRETTKNHHP